MRQERRRRFAKGRLVVAVAVDTDCGDDERYLSQTTKTNGCSVYCDDDGCGDDVDDDVATKKCGYECHYHVSFVVAVAVVEW